MQERSSWPARRRLPAPCRYRHGLGPAEHESDVKYKEQGGNQDRPDRIDVAQRVQCEPPGAARCVVAESERRPAMRDFVQDDRQHNSGPDRDLRADMAHASSRSRSATSASSSRSIRLIQANSAAACMRVRAADVSSSVEARTAWVATKSPEQNRARSQPAANAAAVRAAGSPDRAPIARSSEINTPENPMCPRMTLPITPEDKVAGCSASSAVYRMCAVIAQGSVRLTMKGR